MEKEIYKGEPYKGGEFGEPYKGGEFGELYTGGEFGEPEFDDPNIYAIVPLSYETDPEKRSQLLKILKENPNTFFKAKKLVELLGLKQNHGQAVQVGKMITELLELGGEPVVGLISKGYAYSTNNEEIWNSLEENINRRTGLNRRIAALGKLLRNGRVL